MVITHFLNDYWFLSNFYEHAPLTFNGKTYLSSEAAYQAQKCPERADEFTTITPGQAKRLGKVVPLRADWEAVKVDLMYQIVLAKFIQNPSVLKRLLATGDAVLEEGNNWGDTYWGKVDGVGENVLGKILMRVRAELRGAE